MSHFLRDTTSVQEKHCFLFKNNRAFSHMPSWYRVSPVLRTLTGLSTFYINIPCDSNTIIHYIFLLQAHDIIDFQTVEVSLRKHTYLVAATQTSIMSSYFNRSTCGPLISLISKHWRFEHFLASPGIHSSLFNVHEQDSVN